MTRVRGALEGEKARLEEALTAVQATLTSRTEKVAQVESALGQAQRELTELEAVSAGQAQAAQQKLADAEGARDEVRAEREQLATELAQSQAEMTRVRGALEGEKARLEEALTAVQATLTSRTEKVAQVESALGQAQRELTELEAVSAGQAQAAQQKLADVEAERDAARTNRDNLATELTASRTDAARMRPKIEGEQARHEDEVQSLRAALESQNEAAAGLKEALGGARRELAAVIDARTTLAESLEAQDRKHVEAADSATAHLKALQVARDRLRERAIEQERALNQARRMGEELIAHRDDLLARAERGAVARGRIANELDVVTKRFERLTAESRALAAKGSALQQQLVSARFDRDQIQSTLTSTVTQLREELADTATRLRHSEQQATTQSGELATLAEKLSVSDAQRQRLRTRLATFEQELASLSVAHRELTGQFEQLTSERDALRAQGRQLEDARGTLRQKLTTTAGQLESARTRATDLTQRYEGLLSRSSSLSELTAAQRGELENTRKALERTQSEVARLSDARGIYTVQHGDSLSSIATFFYRNGNRWREILNANGHLIGDNPDLIFSNMVLIIPQ